MSDDVGMTTPRVFFMNVGWMTTYQALKGEHISGGSEYVKNHGYGDESFERTVPCGRSIDHPTGPTFGTLR